MREIKFRVLDKNIKGFFRYYSFPNCRWGGTDCRDCGVMEQFTGICDKNGKEIFEGDICQYTRTKRIFHIWWNTPYACWSANVIGIENPDEMNALSMYENEECEVIGNVHETPALLKEK